MKKGLVFLLLLFSIQAIACPACNIHNYLGASVRSSTYIYEGKVIGFDQEKEQAIILIQEIIRSNKKHKKQVGDTFEKYLHNGSEKIGNTYIFSDAQLMSVPDFPVLDPRFKWEVSYLADTTRQPESINDAMRLLECVSNECNYAGKKYVSEHFNDCYDSLTTRISKLRSENQFSESNEFFQTHRITTLTKALLSGTDNRISSFLLSEMELIRNTNHGNINLDSLSYNGATPLGEYLRVIYKESGTKSFTATIQGSFIEALRSDTGSVLVYYSYALASEDLPKLKEIEFSKGQMDFVVLGTLSAALWYRYYWDRKATPPLLSYLDKINTDQDVKDYIDRRFDGFR